MNHEFCYEAKRHFNEPILIGFDLCRCIGYAEDEEDCYLLVQHPNYGRVKHTFVGGYTYLNCLKGQGYVESTSGEDWDDFFRLDTLLELNGAPKEQEFICEIEEAKT